jgi:hypothetical protein
VPNTWVKNGNTATNSVTVIVPPLVGSTFWKTSYGYALVTTGANPKIIDVVYKTVEIPSGKNLTVNLSIDIDSALDSKSFITAAGTSSLQDSLFNDDDTAQAGTLVLYRYADTGVSSSAITLNQPSFIKFYFNAANVFTISNGKAFLPSVVTGSALTADDTVTTKGIGIVHTDLLFIDPNEVEQPLLLTGDKYAYDATVGI